MLRTVALIGNPNSGKSTIFNALTGLYQKTGNYPGVTVERKEGTLRLPGGSSVRVLDLPGTYSLIAKTPDEEIVRLSLLGRVEGESRPDLGVLVLDASNLERNLYLALQVMDSGLPVVIALNLWDAAAERGNRPDPERLSKELGVPCIPTVGFKGEGIGELVRTIARLAGSKEVGEGSRRSGSASQEELDTMLRRTTPEERYRQIELLVERSRPRTGRQQVTLSDRIDAVVTHPIGGWAVFVGVMALMFQSIFTWASPFMDLIEAGVGALGELARTSLPEGALASLFADGIIPGVGNVLIFLPQIFMLFFFIALAEDFGYMTRAAFVLDRVMHKAGLNGRAFLPLLSSFACAIPGIMATRTIADRRDRFSTILVAPLMSCSARLPVYALMIGAFIPATPVLGPLDLKGAVLLSMYLLSLAAGLFFAAVFKRTLFKGRSAPFIMELPPYRIPHWKTVLLATWERGRLFLTNAGSVILAISMVLWFLASYPKPAETVAPLSESARLERTYAGRLGKLIEPVIEPLGFDWKIGVGLVASFAAREVLVSTLAVIYNVGSDADEHSTDLLTALREERDPVTGAHRYTPLVALSLMVFFVLACQCMSTVAIVRRETNGWRWPLFMIAYMTALAWAGSFAVYQIGSRLGVGT